MVKNQYHIITSTTADTTEVFQRIVWGLWAHFQFTFNLDHYNMLIGWICETATSHDAGLQGLPI